jgi:hypothetical protein
VVMTPLGLSCTDVGTDRFSAAWPPKRVSAKAGRKWRSDGARRYQIAGRVRQA